MRSQKKTLCCFDEVETGGDAFDGCGCIMTPGCITQTTSGVIHMKYMCDAYTDMK